MSVKSNKIFQQSLALFQRNKLQDALLVLNKSNGDATDFDVQHLYGAIYASMGEYLLAKKFFQNALQLQPCNYPLRYNLGKLEKLAGNLSQAEQIFLTLHQEQPIDADVSNELGAIALARDDLTSAEDYLRKAIAVRPGMTSAIINLAGASVLRGQFVDALAYLDQVEDPENPRFLLQKASIFLKVGKFSESRQVFERLQQSDKVTDLSESELGCFYANFGCVLVELGEFELGEAQYMKAADYSKSEWICVVNMATFQYQVKHDYAAAETLFCSALEKFPSHPDVHDLYAVFLQQKGEYEKALQHQQLALEKRPDSPGFIYHLSMTQMALGQLDVAWDSYESRWVRPEGGQKLDLAIPEWQGESGGGKSILVYREQGLGDEIMWATCLPDLAQEFSSVVYACHPKLVTLLSRTYPEVAIIPNRVPRHPMMLEHFDYQIPIASLPRFFRRRRESFPVNPRSMQDDVIRTAHWRQRLKGLQPNLIVGLAWRSGHSDAIRDVHYLSINDLAPMLELPRVVYINLQYHLSDIEKQQLEERFPGKVLHANEIDLFDDLDASACLMKACDLVVAPCTSSLMLAGALGIPALYLLSLQQDFWMLGSKNYSPWFPTTTVLARGIENSWQSVIEQTSLIILQLAKEKMQGLA
jgi:Flp pilus assembly protein TadD